MYGIVKMKLSERSKRLGSELYKRLTSTLTRTRSTSRRPHFSTGRGYIALDVQRSRQVRMRTYSSCPSPR